MDQIQYVANDCMDHMNAVAKHFKGGAEVTLIVRSPGHPERDFLLTNDDLDELAAVIRRRKEAASEPEQALRTGESG